MTLTPPTDSTPKTPPPQGPVQSVERMTSLDALRGFAILAILPMNALSFGLHDAAYRNVSADGIAQPLDWVFGLLSMIFVDQKAMALFSLLFGVGVEVFASRAAVKGRRVVWLSLWRFFLLAIIGVAHMFTWEGDVLLLYALCAPIVLLFRMAPPKLLVGLGVSLSLAGAVTAPFAQNAISSGSGGLDDYWTTGTGTTSDVLDLWFVADGFGRALGLMLIGVGLYRLGVVQGARDKDYYSRLAVWGLGIGTTITAAGIAFRLITDWSSDYALTGHIPTTIGTVPMALGYMGLIINWNRGSSPLVERFRNLGRMALTNYLTQTALGLTTLGYLADRVDVTRTMIVAWFLAVWALQLWWSTWWLARFRYGPFEWAWRCATYRSLQPMLR